MRTLLAVLGVLLLCVSASAHDDRTPHAHWLNNLKDDQGNGCCNMNDCYPTAWRIGKDGYEALVDERFPMSDGSVYGGMVRVTQPFWAPIPPDKIIARDNPFSRPVLCWHDRVICFVRGTEG